jgi:hypothetical protein
MPAIKSGPTLLLTTFPKPEMLPVRVRASPAGFITVITPDGSRDVVKSNVEALTTKGAEKKQRVHMNKIRNAVFTPRVMVPGM